MKKSVILTSALSTLLPLAALAQTPSSTASPTVSATQSIPQTPAVAPVAPAPAVPPAPPAPPAPPHRHSDSDEPKGPVTFLGVETSEVPRVLSEQMDLPRGFGVVVDYIVPKSAAEAGGLQQSDVIRMLNDQQIVNPSQLGKLVRSFPEGSSVDFTIMRKGKEMKLNIKLGKKEGSAGRSRYGFKQKWDFDDFDKNFNFEAPDITSVREAVALAKAQAGKARAEAEKAVRGLRIVTSDEGLTKSTRIDLGKATITFSNDQGELQIENVNGRKMLTAKDAEGKTLYNGPIETPEDRAKLPDNVRQRLQKLERQELPEAPEPPEPPEAPEAPGANQSAQMKSAQRAVYAPNERSGWRRSTFAL